MKDPARGGTGAVLLGQWPLPLLRVSCDKCGRQGQYHTAKLLDRYGADYKLPYLKHELVDCERLRKCAYYDPCRAIFTDSLEVAQLRRQRS